MTPWWTAQQAGLIGGIGGSVIGVAAGVLGLLTGILAPRGRARGLVYGGFATLSATGALLLVAAIVALAQGQPYHVWYPLLLCGGLLSVMMPLLFRIVRITYRQAELRRLEAEELRRT